MVFEASINLLKGIYFLTTFTYSWFKLFNRHYLFLYKCLQLFGMKQVIFAIYVKQLQNTRSDHQNLFKVICNNSKQFVDDLLFLMILITIIKKKAGYHKILVSPKMEPERGISSGLLGCKKLVFFSILGNQSKESFLNQ